MLEHQDPELWAAVYRKAIPAGKLDAFVGSSSAEERAALEAALEEMPEAGYGSPLTELEDRLREFRARPGQASGYLFESRNHLLQAGLRSGWWTEADIDVTVAEGITFHYITSRLYRVTGNALDVVLLRDVISAEEFDLLIEPIRSVFGPVWERPLRL
ncbi:MAG: hypothetical protein M0Z34_02670 [Nitrospiraceae bacterium]|nr:hypothetical protein [Nitrospiraceae bacterium]MDA8209794.1 hypothetical protein [Actinomycetota bacterium]